jgi:hypothetical protein
MTPYLFASSVVLLFIAALIGWCAFLLRGRRTVVSPHAHRAEKNAHHFVSGALVLMCAVAVVAALFVPAVNHPLLWLTVGFTILFIVPGRVIATEFGIRRRTLRGSSPQDC